MRSTAQFKKITVCSFFDMICFTYISLIVIWFSILLLASLLFLLLCTITYDFHIYNYDVLLTVHLSITLVNDQIEAQLFYFIIRLLQSSTCFEQRRAHHQEVKLY